MKNIILIAIIILTFFIYCRKSTLEVIPPNFFSKMKDGNYSGFEVKNGGNTVSIGNTNYTFESDIMGIVGIYQDKTNSSNYVGVFPIGDTMHTVTMDNKRKEALTQILEVVGEENSLNVIKELSNGNGGKLDTEAITKNLDAKKKAEVEKIIKDSGLDKNKFGDYKEYKKT
ncbi:hypothetical protein [uncultured Brachyspira sp.]|uniref:hypothetical protein n=1 Tax=uncultured Brachyspira sp. TaxID=221953 RepID=UPI00259A8C1D|nr:hypothetical protein [uncultured Brachyspira sp.]